MNSPNPGRAGAVPTGLFVVAMALFGLLSALPFFLGPAIGVAGVVLSAVFRGRRARERSGVELIPALTALTVLAISSPVSASAGLFGGLAAVAFLVWLAFDPARSASSGLRAVPSIGLATVGFVVAWVLTLATPATTLNVGLAAGLVAAALIVVTIVLLRIVVAPPGEGPNSFSRPAP